MTLDDLISALADLPGDLRLRTEMDEIPINVGGFHCWRGDYRQLAINYPSEPCTVAEVLEQAREAMSQVFTGYKGGDYAMSGSVQVYLAQPQENDQRELVALEHDTDWNVVVLRWLDEDAEDDAA